MKKILSEKQKLWLEKLHKSNEGKHPSEETKKKMSKSHKGDPRCSYWKGKKQSQETIDKRIKSCKGKIGIYWHDKKGIGTPRWKGGISKDKNHLKLLGQNWIKNNRKYKNFLNIRRLHIKSNIEGSHTFFEWENLKAQYNWICPCCKRQEPKVQLTEDHIIPISKGGSNNIENIQPLCKSCNSIKHTKVIKYEKL